MAATYQRQTRTYGQDDGNGLRLLLSREHDERRGDALRRERVMQDQRIGQTRDPGDLAIFRSLAEQNAILIHVAAASGEI